MDITHPDYMSVQGLQALQLPLGSKRLQSGMKQLHMQPMHRLTLSLSQLSRHPCLRSFWTAMWLLLKLTSQVRHLSSCLAGRCHCLP